MYLSGRTGWRVQFSSGASEPRRRSPQGPPGRYIYFAFPSCRAYIRVLRPRRCYTATCTPGRCSSGGGAQHAEPPSERKPYTSRRSLFHFRSPSDPLSRYRRPDRCCSLLVRFASRYFFPCRGVLFSSFFPPRRAPFFLYRERGRGRAAVSCFLWVDLVCAGKFLLSPALSRKGKIPVRAFLRRPSPNAHGNLWRVAKA